MLFIDGSTLPEIKKELLSELQTLDGIAKKFVVNILFQSLDKSYTQLNSNNIINELEPYLSKELGMPLAMVYGAYGEHYETFVIGLVKDIDDIKENTFNNLTSSKLCK